MANLYHNSTTNNYSSPQEPDDISLFFHQILLPSSSSSSHSFLRHHSSLPTSHHYSCSTSAANLDNETDDYDYESEEAIEAMGAEMPQKSTLLRCSSKRSRAAEVHNLSEKRRRSRINEKMKALQNLIPNSNKTDKASMLDEAIEYLKQLQLQVQMLTMRNGLSIYPNSLPDMLQQPSQVSQTRMDVYGTDKYIDVNMTKEMSMKQNISSDSLLRLPEICAKHDHVSDFSRIVGSKASPDVESSLLQDHFGAFQLSRSSSIPLIQDCPQSSYAGAKATSSVPSETQASSLKENILEACVAGAALY